MGEISGTRTPRRIASPRAASVAGLLFAVLFASVLVLLRSAIPDAPEESLEWSDDAAARVAAAAGIMPFAGIAFLWFLGVLRDTFGEHEDKLFASVFIGSGILFLAMIFVATAIAGGLLSALESETVLDSSVSVISRAVILQITNGYALRMGAVFMLSLGTLWLRTGALPKWVTFLTYAVALVLLFVVSAGMWVTLVFPCWAFAVSVLLLVRSLREKPAPVA